MKQDITLPLIYRIRFPLYERHMFKWQFLGFLFYNYYIIQAVVASSFYSIFLLTQIQLMPINIIFFMFQGINFMFKLVSVPKPEYQKTEDYFNIFKGIKYFLIKQSLIINVTFIVLFIASYFTPFSVARYLRYSILIKAKDLIQFNNLIYERLYASNFLRKAYTIFKITYILFLFSHYFGTWFYLIDQILIDIEFFGNPSLNPDVYYQYKQLCYTSIQMQSDVIRYLYGLYFMVSLITTIAYGDIIGKNPHQEVYTSVLMVISTISLGLIMEQFMDIIISDSLGIYEFIKNYNSLKTCMDDSNVPYETQNRVRSYLVYFEFKKKHHAHQQVTDMLTTKLQQDLKTESFEECLMKWIIPNLPQLQEEVREIANICQLTSFQAQTEIYQQLQTTQTASLCCFLYKISGEVEEYIQLERQKIKLPMKDRKQFNLSKLFLNFNIDEEDDEQFKQEKQTRDGYKKYSLVSINKRKLRNIKISQFIILDAQQFYQLINKRKTWFKRIKTLKQQILSQDLMPFMLGQGCTICQSPDSQSHRLENCPNLHLIYNPRIIKDEIHKVFRNKSERFGKKRQRRQSTKIIRLSLIHKNVFSFFFQKQQYNKQKEKQSLANILKNILNSITDTNQRSTALIDSGYDPNGIQLNYGLQSL